MFAGGAGEGVAVLFEEKNPVVAQVLAELCGARAVGDRRRLLTVAPGKDDGAVSPFAGKGFFLQLAQPLSDIGRYFVVAGGRQEFADLLKLRPAFQRLEKGALVEFPNMVAYPHGDQLQEGEIARVGFPRDGDLMIGQYLESGAFLFRRRGVGVRQLEAVGPPVVQADGNQAVIPAEKRVNFRPPGRIQFGPEMVRLHVGDIEDAEGGQGLHEERPKELPVNGTAVINRPVTGFVQVQESPGGFVNSRATATGFKETKRFVEFQPLPRRQKVCMIDEVEPSRCHREQAAFRFAGLTPQVIDTVKLVEFFVGEKRVESGTKRFR